MNENRAIAAVFDRSAETYDSVIPFFQTFGRKLIDVAEVRRDERVLDVAAGRGIVLRQSARFLKASKDVAAG